MVSEADSGPRAVDQAAPLTQEFPTYTVSPDELAALAQDIQAESERDHLAYLLDMMRAIFISETSPVIMSELIVLCQQVLTDLARLGEWKAMTALVSFLREAQCRADLPAAIKEGVTRLLASLNEPDYLTTLADDLNASPGFSTEGLLTFFLSLNAAAVPVLCQVLTQLKAQHHRLVLCDALPVLARDNVAPLHEALRDSRWFVVRNALFIIGKMKNPDFAGSVKGLSLHKDKRVRREALKTLGLLRSTTEADHLVAVLQDTDEGIRLSALNLLKTRTDRIPWSAWEPVVSSQEFVERSTLELRLTLQALGRTSGEAGVPYFRRLLLQRLWPQRKRRIQLAILAAETLGQMGDPSAIPVLEAGANRFNRAIRDACLAALEKARSHAGLSTKEG
ncbi:MAG: HEAT repeat domain-containing protein [Nitrospirales bacterium]